MPMPKNLKDTERLAICLSYLESSENQVKDALTLDNGACDAYAQQLQFVNSSVAEFKPSEHKMPKSKKEKYKYTIEESLKRRPVKGGHHMVNVYLQTRKVCVNRILVVYKEQLNDGSPPTGAAKEQFIKELRGKLGLDADDADAGGLDGAVDVDAEAEEQDWSQTWLMTSLRTFCVASRRACRTAPNDGDASRRWLAYTTQSPGAASTSASAAQPWRRVRFSCIITVKAPPYLARRAHSTLTCG